MTNQELEEVIVEEFLKASGRIKGTRRTKRYKCEEVYLRIEREQYSNRYILYTSTCAGGAWHQFGKLIIDFTTILELYTIRGIIYAKTDTEKYTFEICEPDFPINAIEFMKKSAVNACTAFRLYHQRSWSNHRRRLKNG